MTDLGTLTMNELLELAKVAQHKRHLHNEAMKRYYAKNTDKFRVVWRDQKRKEKIKKDIAKASLLSATFTESGTV